ncbi:MAG: antitoxin VbhA family protein [Verrucomicrobiota bacterium]
MKALATKPDSAVRLPVFTTDHMRDALGNAALENIELGADALADLGEVVEGRLTPEEYRERVKARHGIPV